MSLKGFEQIVLGEVDVHVEVLGVGEHFLRQEEYMPHQDVGTIAEYVPQTGEKLCLKIPPCLLAVISGPRVGLWGAPAGLCFGARRYI